MKKTNSKKTNSKKTKKSNSKKVNNKNSLYGAFAVVLITILLFNYKKIIFGYQKVLFSLSRCPLMVCKSTDLTDICIKNDFKDRQGVLNTDNIYIGDAYTRGVCCYDKERQILINKTVNRQQQTEEFCMAYETWIINGKEVSDFETLTEVLGDNYVLIDDSEVAYVDKQNNIYCIFLFYKDDFKNNREDAAIICGVYRNCENFYRLFM